MNQVFQARHAAVSCLKGLPILAVYRAETDVHQLCIVSHKLRLAGAAEYLLKMHGLAFIGDINHDIRIVFRHTFTDGSQIRGAVEGGAVGF